MGSETPFFQTRMGHTYYNGTMPRIAKALTEIAEAMEAEGKTVRDELAIAGTLRDEFAMAALPVAYAMLGDVHIAEVVRRAYNLADAMLAERAAKVAEEKSDE